MYLKNKNMQIPAGMQTLEFFLFYFLFGGAVSPTAAGKNDLQ